MKIIGSFVLALTLCLLYFSVFIESAAAADAWPCSVSTDVGGGLPAVYEPSGVVYSPALDRLFVIHDGGTLSRMGTDGSSVTNWSPGGDLEGVALVPRRDSYVYLGIEQPDRSIQEFNLSTGMLTGNSWILTPWMGGAANSGLEGLTFVPNGYHPYDYTSSGGLFYASLQADGSVHVFDANLSVSGSVSQVTSFTPKPGLTDLADLYFCKETNVLYGIYDANNLLIEMQPDGTILREYNLPNNDQEGITVIPSSTGSGDIFVAEDTGTVWRWDDYPTPCTGIDTSPPADPVKLCFIHHSCGSNWLSNGNGNLGTNLNGNNYYVTESDYGWDAQPGDNLGDHTDTTDWPSWFTDTKMPYVYANSYHSAYANTIGDPGGENDIVMFKSCYPNSEVGANIDDEKAIYNSLLPYFSAHTDKLFALITPPGETVVSSSARTRELCDWLVDGAAGWLAGYTGGNVVVFDFYGVLSETDSHHRVIGGEIEHVYSPTYDGTSPYHTGDDHPNAAGNQKSTAEFMLLLNVYYHQWMAATAGAPTVATSAASGITSSSATLNGNITDIGGGNCDQRGFNYREQGAGSWNETVQSGSYGTGAYNLPASSLDPNTTYEFQAKAHNSAGWDYGDTLTFTTSVAVPTVTTSAAGSVMSSSATLNGNITGIGGENCDQRGFDYREQGSPTWDYETVQSGSYGTGAYNRSASSLDPNTTYEFRAKAHNSAGWGYGTMLTFTTSVALPTVATSAASGVTSSGATLNGNITDIGGENCDQRGFDYREQGAGSWTNEAVQSGSYGTGTYGLPISGLDPNTTYEFRSKAHNSAGWGGYGTTLTFTTSVALPTATTNAASGVTSSGATLNGNITDIGGENCDQRGFDYRELGSGTWDHETVQSGSYGTGAFNRSASSLDPNTTYEFRSKAHNSAGWGYGTTLTFTTSVAIPTVTTNAASGITSSSATLNGNTTDIGGENCDQRGFDYREQGSPTWDHETVQSGSYGTGAFNRSASSLDPNTTYEFRSKAHNSAGWGYGTTLTFTTSVALPTVVTDAASEVERHSASLNANITDLGGQNCDQRGFDYREQGAGSWSETVQSGSYGTGLYDLPVSGLDAGTTYEFCAKVHNSAGWDNGDTLTFTTPVADPPSVTTTAPTNVTTTTADGGGDVTDDGGAAPITARGVCWSTSADPTTADDHTSDGTGMGAFTSSIEGLDQSTHYYVRAYATNSVGTAYGTQEEFTTLTASIPRPVVNSISPASGPPGTQATISGSNFGATRGSSSVTVGGVQASVVSWSDTRIVIAVPRGTTGGAVIVTTSAGASNADKLFSVVLPSTWYLAEGTSDYGFDTFINIENPNATAVTAEVTYMTRSGPRPRAALTLPALSQTVINPRDDVGSTDFSTKVECREGKAICVDRRMTWQGAGAPSQEGHASVGVTSPAKTWYLAEGSSKWGFETWLLIQNPNATPAECTVTYMTDDAGPIVRTHTVAPNARASYSMETDIGQKDASIKVEASVPVIPERAMYRYNRREGHDSIGTTALAKDYYLAEGTTDWGFTTYVLVQNPNSSPNTVNITYMTPSGPVSQPAFTVSANSRQTVRVNDVPGMSKTDCSVRVSGSLPLIAERAMYWGAGTPLGEACHDSIGMDAPHTTFYLPDGESQNGYETWTLVQNPNSAAVQVDISYLTTDGKGNVTKTEAIPANSRRTFNMLDHSGMAGRASIIVTCRTTGKKIMVERAMYWNGRGAGTDTIGGVED